MTVSHLLTGILISLYGFLVALDLLDRREPISSVRVDGACFFLLLADDLLQEPESWISRIFSDPEREGTTEPLFSISASPGANTRMVRVVDEKSRIL